MGIIVCVAVHVDMRKKETIVKNVGSKHDYYTTRHER